MSSSHDGSQLPTRKRRKHLLDLNEEEQNDGLLNHAPRENVECSRSRIPLATISNSTVTSRPTKRKRRI